MKKTIVETDVGVTILGGGKAGCKTLSRALRIAPVLVAADKGCRRAVKCGHEPFAVIGDLDDAPKVYAGIPADRLHRIDEQITTDFEKCLYSIKAPFALAVGMSGSRLDHSLAALSILARWREMPVFLMSGKDVAFRCPAELALRLPVGTRLSLFPLAEVTGRSTGLEWPIDSLLLSPLGRIGTSNRTVSDQVTIGFDQPGALVILPAGHLDAALSAFGLSSSER